MIPKDLVQQRYKTHPVEVRNLVVAKAVLEQPDRIYYGVREHQEGGWCYSGRPANYYMRDYATVPLPGDLVFTVYMSPCRHVYLWRLDEADPVDNRSPKDWKTRYERVAWKRDS